MLKRLLKSLQVRIVLIFVFLIFLPFLYITNFNFTWFEEVQKQKSVEIIQFNLEQMGRNIETMCNDCIKLSNVLGTDEVILENLAANNGQDGGQKDLFHLSSEDFIRTVAIEERLNYAKTNVFYNYLTDVLLLGADGMVYCSNDVSDHFATKQFYNKQYADPEWFVSIANRESYLFWDTSFRYGDPALAGGGDDRYISVQRVIYDEYLKNAIGLLFINFSKQNLTDLLERFGGDTVLLLDENNELICQCGDAPVSAEAEGLTGESYTTEDGIGYTVNQYELNKFSWKLLSLTDDDHLTAEVSALKTRTFYLSILMILAVMGISLWLMIYMIKPIKRLQMRIRQMNIGEYSPSDLPPAIQEHGGILKSDVSDLVANVECLSDRAEVLVERVLEEQALKANLQYEALRAQINPHFLFNTLNTIRWSAMMSGNKTTMKMITELGKLMEVSMNKGNEEISLQQEIELVEAYVYIQNIRFNNVITLTVHLPKPLENHQIIKLLLQPIVENAINHGLKFQPGRIDINVFSREDALIIDVTDSGPGFPDAVQADGGSDVALSGIGLKNVRERIQLRYGAAYGLIISPEEAKACIRLVLPLLPQEERGKSEGAS
ncbi:MAG: histidine kinase [Clostridiales bacterium]|nr:histidine kinase [Clostridiales bacterium]